MGRSIAAYRGRSARRGRGALAGASLAFVGAAILPIAFSFADQPADLAALGCAIMLAVAVLILSWARVRAGRFDPFEPGIWLGSWWVLRFGLLTPLVVGTPPASVNGLTTYWITVAEIYVAIGGLTFIAGYAVTTRRPAGSSWIRWDWLAVPRSIHLPRVILIFVIGAVTKVGMLLTGIYGYALNQSAYNESLSYLQWLSYLQNFTLAAIVLLLIDLSRTPPKQRLPWLLLAGMLAFELGFQFLSGMKSFVLAVPVALLMAYWYGRGRVLWQLPLAAIMLLFVLVPVNQQFRGGLNSGALSRTDPAAEIGALGSALNTAVFQQTVASLLSADGQYLASRLSLISSVGLAVEYTPQPNPYLLGHDYIWLVPYTFVPRAVWPDKPILQSGYDFSVNYEGLPPTTHSSTAPTWFGDLYMNFGPVGVPLGMLLLGAIYGCLYEIFRRNRTPQIIFIYIMAFSSITDFEADVPTMLGGLVKLLIVLVPLVWLVYPNARRVASQSFSLSSPMPTENGVRHMAPVEGGHVG